MPRGAKGLARITSSYSPARRRLCSAASGARSGSVTAVLLPRRNRFGSVALSAPREFECRTPEPHSPSRGGTKSNASQQITLVSLHHCQRACRVGDRNPFFEVGENQSAVRLWVTV